MVSANRNRIDWQPKPVVIHAPEPATYARGIVLGLIWGVGIGVLLHAFTGLWR